MRQSPVIILQMDDEDAGNGLPNISLDMPISVLIVCCVWNFVSLVAFPARSQSEIF